MTRIAASLESISLHSSSHENARSTPSHQARTKNSRQALNPETLARFPDFAHLSLPEREHICHTLYEWARILVKICLQQVNPLPKSPLTAL